MTTERSSPHRCPRTLVARWRGGARGCGGGGGGGGGGTCRITSPCAARVWICSLVRNEGPYAGALRKEVNIVDFDKDRATRCLLPLRRYTARRTSSGDALLPSTTINILASSRSGCRAWIRASSSASATASCASAKAVSTGSCEASRRFSTRWLTVLSPYSQEMKLELSRDLGLPDKRIVAIPNPVDTENDCRSCRATCPRIPGFMIGEKPVILAMGRLVAQKELSGPAAGIPSRLAVSRGENCWFLAKGR